MINDKEVLEKLFAESNAMAQEIPNRLRKALGRQPSGNEQYTFISMVTSSIMSAGYFFCRKDQTKEESDLVMHYFLEKLSAFLKQSGYESEFTFTIKN